MINPRFAARIEQSFPNTSREALIHWHVLQQMYYQEARRERPSGNRMVTILAETSYRCLLHVCRLRIRERKDSH